MGALSVIGYEGRNVKRSDKFGMGFMGGLLEGNVNEVRIGAGWMGLIVSVLFLLVLVFGLMFGVEGNLVVGSLELVGVDVEDGAKVLECLDCLFDESLVDVVLSGLELVQGDLVMFLQLLINFSERSQNGFMLPFKILFLLHEDLLY